MSVVHRTYARALYEAAEGQKKVAEVCDGLSGFAASTREVPELRALLTNPKLDPRARAAALRELLGAEDELVRSFVLLLAEKGRAGEVEEIARELERLVAASEGQIEVELTTAYELGDADAAVILKQIEAASGRRIEATRSVDRNLIGGLVLQAGSLRLDASVRGRLERLRRELIPS